jgi:hypothetical protein
MSQTGQYVLIAVVLWNLIVWGPISWLTGRVWRQLADSYPAAPRREGRSIWITGLFAGERRSKNLTRLTLDDGYLHFSPLVLFRLGRPPFSVPWSDLAAAPEVVAWGLGSFPAIRVTFARNSAVSLLLSPGAFKQVVSASQGRAPVGGPATQTPASPARTPAAQAPTRDSR